VPARRIVSLIPSITEILFAIGAGDRVVGCTIYCTEPPEGVATKTRIGGEKNPKLELIRDLGTDLVIANVEENVREHVETLRAWGISVHVTYPRTVADGIRLVGELGELLEAGAPARELEASLRARYDEVRAATGGRRPRRVFCPIWRKPYMTINADTYIHDMLAVSGGINVFGGAGKRYPEVTLDEVAATGAEVILLPDEPYRFRHVHQADFAPYPDLPAVRDGRMHLVDGKLLSWYGPRIAEALRVLPPLFWSEGVSATPSETSPSSGIAPAKPALEQEA
jgi:ABC-type Fe3+-hydroxamate transport system substrate-binding protein